MKKKLRLLVTKNCNRKCEGCCNKDWDLSALETIGITDAAKYEEVMITGGEPMLYGDNVLRLANDIKTLNPKVRIFIYTAHIKEMFNIFLRLGTEGNLVNIDGFHVTVHEDIKDMELEYLRMIQDFKSIFSNQSMRLQIFPDVTKRVSIRPSFWKRITFNQWIKNCPLPIEEDFKRLETLFN